VVLEIQVPDLAGGETLREAITEGVEAPADCQIEI
jgi:hypothetical protein